MVDKLGDAGSGRAAVEVQAVNFNNAVDAWHKASNEKKGEFAAAVLSLLFVGGLVPCVERLLHPLKRTFGR